MGGSWSITTRAVGEVLTAAKYNADNQAAVDNETCQLQDDYSTNAAQMQATTDPYPAGVADLPTTLAGELERIRYQLNGIIGGSYWYVDAPATLTTLATSWTTATFASGKFTTTGVGARWIVTATDCSVFRYKVIGKRMDINFRVNNSTISGTPASVKLAIPASQKAKTLTYSAGFWATGSNSRVLQIGTTVSGTALVLRKATGSWAATTSGITLMGTIGFEVA